MNAEIIDISFILFGLLAGALSLIFSLLAAAHISTWVESPKDRMWWVILVMVFPIIGPLVYYFTKYQRFREIGKKEVPLLDDSPFSFREFVSLTEKEKLGGAQLKGDSQAK